MANIPETVVLARFFPSMNSIDFWEFLAYINRRENEELKLIRRSSMKSRTYYDILGVSRDATLEEITTAKNALAKVYHPDANVHKNIDTTAFMQEILEAYRVLADPEQRKAYDQETFGSETVRVFRTFKGGPDDDTKEDTVSFVTYWNAAAQLNDIVTRSSRLMEREAKRKKPVRRRFFHRSDKSERSSVDSLRERQITQLSLQAVQYITELKMAGISMDHWNAEAMNWVLVRWGQKKDTDYHVLFNRYAAYIEQSKSGAEKMKLRSQNRQFHNNLKKLLSYALKA